MFEPKSGPATSYSVTIAGEAEQLMQSIAEAWQITRPCSLGPLGQLPDIASAAFARGLVEIAEESGLEVDREHLLGAREGDMWRANESAIIAREAVIVRGRDNRLAMSRMAEAFPTLRDAPGVRPWDPAKLDGWLRSSPSITSGSRDAAAFVLGLWNGSGTWSASFDVHRALSAWDGAHRAAFLAWASAPWWP
jgi:hypothetical protein